MNQEKNNETIKLTTFEKSELWIEGIFTLLIMILLNLSIIFVLNIILVQNAEFNNLIFATKQQFVTFFNSATFYSWQKFYIAIMLIIDIWVVVWRLKRRYRQMQLSHIINELHYISLGNFEHRIPFKLKGDLEQVVQSINSLVDSTLQAIEEERAIEKSKDELITNVSHDIRTPLTSILGYLGLIEENKLLQTDDIRSYTHVAFSKAKQMKVLVDDLFEYTKVRQPNKSLTFSNIDLHAMIDQLSVEFELQAQKKAVIFSVSTDPEKIYVELNPEKFVRVFENLITNALKYGKDATIIEINAKIIGKEVIITVRNNGQQIPPQSLDKLFDRFYRVEDSRNQETGGSGLGLAIAQNIIAQHHGYIYAESNHDWTSFIIHLPLKQNFLRNSK
ncbi:MULTISPECIES: HAMP domain-containing sensor histidine kinase [unclassified Enterococcus]|uniref:sensor histidine kinase n=1 Tax=unclassified Enterococcus TaxID=2608891 RepID=UPI001552BDDE|nr:MULTISPECIES: HAMP domain-containing sensor histidine kinase [unclassified Enterococcus]MBS7578418.1 HAMP domain-containing histidine kinase [Enterococcus sp. MMGLQ5-2]MBS7585649.1 HAMP domain-containing histidine kinase [Enterococcus sp. MMGLQ5-1]